MSMLELYLLFVFLPGLASALGFICLFGFIFYGCALFFGAVAGDLHEDDVSYYIRPLLKWWIIIVLILCGVVSNVLPSKKDMIVLTGAYVVTNQAEMAKLPNNILKAANTYLENLQNSLKEKKESK